MPSALLSDELRPLYLSRGVYPPVMAIAAYFDESWETQSGILAVAGYLGPVKMWDEDFSPAWWQIIKAAPHPITEFKASDCRQMTGEFHPKFGWTRDECKALTEDLVSLLVDHPGDFGGIGAAVLIDYQYQLSDAVRDMWVEGSDDEIKKLMLDDAYQTCAGVIGLQAIKFTDDPIQIVFDERSEGRSRIQDAFVNMKRAPKLIDPQQADRVRLPYFGRSCELAPLQAADLLAYETYKEMKNRSESPPRQPSKALQRLVEGRVHRGFYMTLRELLEMEYEIRRPEPGRVFPEIYDRGSIQRLSTRVVEGSPGALGESGGEDGDNPVDGSNDILQATDDRHFIDERQSIPRVSLLQRYLEGKLTIHVHTRTSPNMQQFCAVFYRARGSGKEHDFLDLNGLSGFSAEGDVVSPGSGDRQIKYLMLVPDIQVMQEIEGVDRGIVGMVRLISVNDCVGGLGDPLYLSSTRGFVALQGVADREAGIPVRGFIVRDDQLPDKMIKCRTEIVDDIADDKTPSGGGRKGDAGQHDQLSRLRVFVADGAIGVKLKKSLHLSLECTEVLYGPVRL